jgi:hypothetical protein
MRALRLAFALTALSAAACATPCEELASKICACEGSLAAIDACEQRATQTEDLLDVTEEDQNRCDGFVDSCDCHALDTAEGKRRCGLAE